MASDINSIMIVGRLTRDSELKYSSSGVAIARLSIANNQARKVGDNWEEESHFFDAVMLGRRAEALNQYLTKGKQIAVHGTLQQSRWQDKQTGQNRSRVEIFVNDIQLLGSRSGSDSSQSSDYSSYNTSNAGQDSTPPESDFDDDIPF